MRGHGVDRGAVRRTSEQISSESLYAHTKKLWRQNPGADGIYVHGGGWQTVKVVEMLERDLQVPVVHAQVCNAWMIHKQLMVRETMPGYGRPPWRNCPSEQSSVAHQQAALPKQVGLL